MTAKTGIVIISEGVYRIPDNEGRAIASFIPPVFIKDIPWDTLTDAQTYLLYEMAIRWEIIAHWLVSFRTRAVDTKQIPFTLLDFLDQKLKAELYSIQLDLCAVIWEEIEIRKYYPTPCDWWIECIRQNQQQQIKSILSNGNSITKGEVEDNTRDFRRSLDNGIIPFTESHENLHLYRLFNSAINLRKKYKQINDFWVKYLKQLNKLAKEIKSTSEIKAITILGGHLYYRDRNTLKSIPITRVEKDTVLY